MPSTGGRSPPCKSTEAALYWTEGEGSRHASCAPRSTVARNRCWWKSSARTAWPSPRTRCTGRSRPATWSSCVAAALDGSNVRTLSRRHVASAGALAASGDRVFQVDRVSDESCGRIPRARLSSGSEHQPAATSASSSVPAAARPAGCCGSGRRARSLDGLEQREDRARRLDGSEVEDLLTEREVGGGLTWDPVRRGLSVRIDRGPFGAPTSRAATRAAWWSGPCRAPRRLRRLAGVERTDTRGPPVLSSLYRLPDRRLPG